jgi:hypothetical protein
MKRFNISQNFIVMDDDYFIGKQLNKSDFFYVENEKLFHQLYQIIFLKKHTVLQIYIIIFLKGEQKKRRKNRIIHFLSIQYILHTYLLCKFY